MKNVLVTGGAGYVGSNLIRQLLKNYPKISINSLDNYFTGNISNHIKDDRVEYINGNTWDIRSIFKQNDFDTIFHFGEYSRIAQSFEDIDFVHKSIVSGTFEVLQFALNNNSKIIYSASSSKFGNNGENEHLSPYAYFKAKNIELLRNYNKWFNLKYEISYFYNVYGRNHIRTGKYATVIGIFEDQYLRNSEITVFGTGLQTRDFTHIDDICSGLLKICKCNKNHEYFLRSGKAYKIIEIAKSFSENIKYLNERKGERFEVEDFQTDTNEILQWNSTVNIMEYIKSFKRNN